MKGAKLDVLPPVEKQRVFHRFALVELLFEVSKSLNGGLKYYNRLNLVDGTSLDGETLGIRAIPDDCKLVIVKHVPQKSHDELVDLGALFKGLKGNIYDVRDEKALHLLKTQKMKESIT